MKRKKTLTAVLATVLALGVAPSGALAATSTGTEPGDALTIESVRAAPDPVVLYATKTSTVTVDVAVELRDHDLEMITASIRPVGAPAEYLETDNLTPVAGEPDTYRAVFTIGKAVQTGTWRVDVSAEDKGGNIQFLEYADTFSVKRNTNIREWKASPEPVHRGSAITLGGRLVRMDPEAGYVDYSGKRVGIYFRAAGTETRVFLEYTTTDSSGRFRTSEPAAKDGVWYAVFEGTAHHDAHSSGGDYVDVL